MTKKKVPEMKEMKIQEILTFYSVSCMHSQFNITVTRSDYTMKNDDSFTPVEIILGCPICNRKFPITSNGVTQIEICRKACKGEPS